MKLEKLSNVLAEQITGEWGHEGEDVAVLRTTNFTNEGRLNLNEVVRRSISKDKILKKRLKLGDTIIEKSGGSPTQPVGRVVYFDVNGQDYLCNNFTSILRPSKDVDPRYLFWFLFANHLNKRTLNYQNKTTGIINLKLERYLEETRIPLPPLPIQKKIAAILDKADSLRQKDKQLLEHYNKLAESIFYDMFGDPVRNEKGWNFISLSDHGNFKNGINYSRDEKGFEVSCLGVADFKSRWVISENEKLSKIALSSLPSAEYFLKDGDLVFVRSNGNKELIGRCVMIHSREENITFSGFCIRYRPNDVSCSRYLAHLFRIPSFKKYMLQNGRGANIQNINQELLGSLRVPFPKIELQKQFSIRIDQIELLKSKCEDSIRETEKLFASLTQRAFKGELVKET